MKRRGPLSRVRPSTSGSRRSTMRWDTAEAEWVSNRCQGPRRCPQLRCRELYIRLVNTNGKRQPNVFDTDDEPVLSRIDPLENPRCAAQRAGLDPYLLALFPFLDDRYVVPRVEQNSQRI